MVDCDGTIIKHQHTEDQMLSKEPEILDGVLETFEWWYMSGYVVFITSARQESGRKRTVEQLTSIGIPPRYYRELLMDVGAGERWVINDAKPDMPITARAFTVERDGGLGEFLHK